MENTEAGEIFAQALHGSQRLGPPPRPPNIYDILNVVISCPEQFLIIWDDVLLSLGDLH